MHIVQGLLRPSCMRRRKVPKPDMKGIFLQMEIFTGEVFAHYCEYRRTWCKQEFTLADVVYT